jgi:chromatin segregation and condensation protein Rec8/ScpA/Scc1 (kleisin family)
MATFPGAERPDENRFHDDLIGLDPADPEAKAFAEHLDRMERERPGYTVEGYLAGVEEFADSANRASGQQRLLAVLVVFLILLGVVLTVWFGLGEILGILFG